MDEFGEVVAVGRPIHGAAPVDHAIGHRLSVMGGEGFVAITMAAMFEIAVPEVREVSFDAADATAHVVMERSAWRW